ncbi:hypothetical protein [Novosphingobium sp. JCM 18896]|uniref:hypothetical protein n=1 Tax=Novosphingobium sp. JCM 18896 TaxID=2989731 RepID=UPI0022237875|nr:hypothetical protein [Novosphingobium sp. JCM 18896]MCW1430353.1 hypothetical protein [Novosphingobium sp. JCM 18896]
MTEPELIDLFTGDHTGLAVPAHAEALHAAGADFLTRAFRAFGAIDGDNAVARVVELVPCAGGSTGDKLFLTVEYARPEPGLDTRLFVKFSRDFVDERRDRQRWEMQSEVPFEMLTRRPGFPIRVPRAYFADFDGKTGTGLIVTERIAYGENTGEGAIEPHRRKCLDHLTMDDPLPYYREVVTALARLCAAHKAGRLAPDIDAVFPFDPVTGSADPIRYDAAGLQAELDHCFAFAERAPQLLPPEVRSAEFHAQMARDAHRIREHEAALQRYLTGNRDLVALCHWNAHIDNCFFWRDQAGDLHTGLIDWGRVGQITFGSILWGGLSAAHHDIWDHHIDELLALFASEYHAHGGPLVTKEEVEFHLTLHMATMGVSRVLAFPEVILFRLPECVEAEGPQDAMFLPVDPARNSLHIYTVFLKFWRRQDFGAALDRLLARG